MLAIYKVRTESNKTKLIVVEVRSGGHAAIIAKKLDSNPSIKHTMLIQTDIDEIVTTEEALVSSKGF